MKNAGGWNGKGLCRWENPLSPGRLKANRPARSIFVVRQAGREEEKIVCSQYNFFKFYNLSYNAYVNRQFE